MNELDGTYEYPQGFKRGGVNIEPGGEWYCDKSYTTAKQDMDWPRELSRHPKRKRHKVVGKKWIQTKYGRTKYLNKRYEDEQ